MAGRHQSHKRAKATTKRKTGARRAKPQCAQAYTWLGAGAITLGVGAAMASGSGIAHADDTGSDTSSSPKSSSADGSPSGNGPTSTGTARTATNAADTTGSAGSDDGAKSTPDHPTRHTSPASRVSSSGGSVSSATTTSRGSRSALARRSASTATQKPGESSTGTHATMTSPAAHPSITQIATPTVAPTVLASTNPASPLALPQLAELAWSAVRQYEDSQSLPASASTGPTARTMATSQTLAAETVATPVAKSTPPSITEMLQHAFSNKTPTADPAQSPGQTADGVVTGDLNADDPDGNEVTYTVTEQPTHGSVVVNPDGSYTYAPNTDLANNGGTDHFTVSVDDGAAYRTTDGAGAILGLFHSLAQAIGLSGSDTSTVTVPVSITATNEPPTITGDTKTSTDTSGVVTGSVTAADPNNDQLTFSGPTHSAGGGTVSVQSDGSYSYTPTVAQRRAAAVTGGTTTDSFTVTVSDGHGGTATAPVTVAISPAPLPQPGDIRAQPGGARRAIYTPNVAVGSDWLGIDPANGGVWLTDADVNTWLDVPLPTGTPTSGNGPYSPGDIKVEPTFVAGSITRYAIKTGPPLDSITPWFVCSTQNACSAVPDSYVAGWVDVKLPNA
jgi:VCBS repeat-containing protein